MQSEKTPSALGAPPQFPSQAVATGPYVSREGLLYSRARPGSQKAVPVVAGRPSSLLLSRWYSRGAVLLLKL